MRYARAPLENCNALNEDVLCVKAEDGGLSYPIADLCLLNAAAGLVWWAARH
jgi:hypothetical protein